MNPDLSPPHDITLSPLLKRLTDVRRSGDGWSARCPAHDDRRNSLTVHTGDDGRTLVKCHRGCTAEAITRALGASLRDLFPQQPAKGHAGDVVRYSYHDPVRNVRVDHCRTGAGDAKRTWWEQEDGIRGLKDTPISALPLWGTDALSTIPLDIPILFVEGEKAAVAASVHGFVSVTNAGGAGQRGFGTALTILRDRRVFLWADNDPPGRALMQRVAAALQGIAADVRLLEPPNMPERGDAYDFFAAGRTAAELSTLIAAAPLVTAGDLGDHGDHLNTGYLTGYLDDHPRSSRKGDRLNASVSRKSGDTARVRLVRLADVEPEAVSFHAYPYLPKAKLVLLEGDPGVGKSTVALAFATAISLGRGLPGMTPTDPANVLVCSVEDGLGDSIRPRLDALGADVTRVHAVDGPLTFDAEGLDRLEEFVTHTTPALVVVDPIVGYMGGDRDIHRANAVREVMAALADLAARYAATILCIRHLSKGGQTKSIYRGLGSIDFTAAARSVLLAGANPANPHERALVHIKSNVGPIGEAIGYSLEAGRFTWTGPSTLTAAQLLAPEPGGEGTPGVRGAVEEFLRETLADGPRPAEAVIAEAERLGIATKSTLRRARSSLGVIATPLYTPGQRGATGWSWQLPAREEHADPEPDPDENPPKHLHLGDHDFHVRRGDRLNAAGLDDPGDHLNGRANGTTIRTVHIQAGGPCPRCGSRDRWVADDDAEGLVHCHGCKPPPQGVRLRGELVGV